MRVVTSLLIALLLVLLAACGGQPRGGAVAPSAPPTTTSAPPLSAAPTLAPEASAAPEPTQAPAITSAPAATDTPAPTAAPPTATSAPPTATPARATANPAAPTAAPAPQPSEDSQDALLIVQRSGGIAGLTEIMIVYADGRLEFSGDVAQTQGQATPAEISSLRQLLASPEFAALSSRYTAMGADLFTYAISVPGSGKNVVTMDGAKNPPVLDQLLAELQPLLKRAR